MYINGGQIPRSAPGYDEKCTVTIRAKEAWYLRVIVLGLTLVQPLHGRSGRASLGALFVQPDPGKTVRLFSPPVGCDRGLMEVARRLEEALLAHATAAFPGRNTTDSTIPLALQA